MWTVSHGNCSSSSGCISSPNFPQPYELGDICFIDITQAWKGFLWVDYLYASSFHVDGELISTVGLTHQHAGIHGLVPSDSIRWTGAAPVDYHVDHQAWRICHVDSMPPFSVSSAAGECGIDREGCVFFGPQSYESETCWTYSPPTLRGHHRRDMDGYPGCCPSGHFVP